MSLLFLTQESYKWPDVYFSLWIYHYLDLNEKNLMRSFYVLHLSPFTLFPPLICPWFIKLWISLLISLFFILKSISSFNFFNSNDKFIKHNLEFIIYYCNYFSFIIVNICHCVLWFLPLKSLEFETYYLFFIATVLAYIFIICQFCLVDFHLLCICSPHKLIQKVLLFIFSEFRRYLHLQYLHTHLTFKNNFSLN